MQWNRGHREGSLAEKNEKTEMERILELSRRCHAISVTETRLDRTEDMAKLSVAIVKGDKVNIKKLYMTIEMVLQVRAVRMGY